MSRLGKAKRTIGLLVLLMAAIVALSGPVAEVLDLPAPVAEAKKKQKKKKKKKQTNTYTTIYCPNQGSNCVGTTGNDFLVGTSGLDYIQGREGNDFYYPKGGSDYLQDSRDGNDYYYEDVKDFGSLVIDDDGGTNVLDLSRRYSSGEFDPERDGDDLFLDGPGGNNVRIVDYFDGNTFFYFQFSDGLKTLDENNVNALQDASASEKAEVQENVVEDSPAEQISSDSDQDTTNQENR